MSDTPGNIERFNHIAHTTPDHDSIQALGRVLSHASRTAPPPPPGTSAQTRGLVLLGLPLSRLPPAARDAAQANCKRYGGCIEVMLDAYITYAAEVEGCAHDPDAE